MTQPTWYLRLRWPGIDDPDERRTTPLGDALARTVYAVTRQSDATVEALVYTGHRTSELLLTAGDGSIGSMFSLIESAQDALPRTLGFELVTATRFGETPALTACLLGPGSSSPNLSVSATALRQYLTTLLDAGVSHAVQVRVATADAARRVSLRAALYDRDRQWVSDADHAAAIADGTFDPATYFEDDAITSSWQLPVDGTWSVSAAAPVSGADADLPRLYQDVDKHRTRSFDADVRPDARKRLARSPEAFDALRERLSSSRKHAYEPFDVDPWLTVDPETLPAFLEHVPAYFDRDPWPAVPGWERPSLTVESILREAPGTEPATTPDQPSPTSDPVERLALDDAPEHAEGVAAWFLTRGTLRNADAFPTATFEVVRKGRPRPVLVVTDSTLIPGQLIDLVNRAVRANTTAYLVADTEATADRIATVLAEPFRDATQSRTRFYTTTQHLETDGMQAVYPRSLDAPEWWFTPDNELEVWAGEHRLTRGPRRIGTDSLVRSLPRCRRTDGVYVVVDPNGDRIDSFPTAEALADSYAPLTAPVVPAFLATGLRYGTVLTPTARGYREYHHRPSWATLTNPRYEVQPPLTDVLQRFRDRYTVPTDGQPLGIDQLYPRFCTWLRTVEPYGREFDLDPETIVALLTDDRQWRYPCRSASE